MALGKQVKEALGIDVVKKMEQHTPAPPPPKRNPFATIVLPIDPVKWLAYFKKVYQHLWERDFIEDETSLKVIHRFNAPEQKKGVALIGKPGTGKTSILVTIGYLLNYTNAEKFDKYDTRKLSADFQDIGVKALNGCTRYPALIDDIGAEMTSSHYGNKANISQVVLEARYINNMLTHITSNYTPDELRDHLGDTCYDRLKQQCDVFVFNGKSKR